VDELNARRDTAEQELEEFIEENSGEDGLLEDVINEKGTVTKANVIERLKAIQKEPENEEEKNALDRCLALIEAETVAINAVRVAQTSLDASVLAQYANLHEPDIKTLVVDDKWFEPIWSLLNGEVQHLTQALAGRVKELEERYAVTLTHLEREASDLGDKVEQHFKQMGLVLV
jgi:type I restriction enzyme M protein